jgi:hypothetical protein
VWRPDAGKDWPARPSATLFADHGRDRTDAALAFGRSWRQRVRLLSGFDVVWCTDAAVARTGTVLARGSRLIAFAMPEPPLDPFQPVSYRGGLNGVVVLQALGVLAVPG